VRHHLQLGPVDGQPEVDLDPGTAELLRWHGCRQRLQKLQSDSWPDTGLVFTGPNGSPLSSAEATGHFHRLVTAVGLPAIQMADLPRVRG
jgi:hypothetical protein